jgi:hypothetical protein
MRRHSRRASRQQRQTRRHRKTRISRRKQRGGEVVEKNFNSVSELRDYLKEATYMGAFQATLGALGESVAQADITSEMRSGGGPLTIPKYTNEAANGTFTVTNENIQGLRFLFA